MFESCLSGLSRFACLQRIHWFTHHKSTNSQFIFDHVSGVLADDFRLAEKPVIAMFVLTTQNVELMVSKNALCLPATQLALSQN